MALIGIGTTKCSICGCVLESLEDATGLHHYIDDPKDPFCPVHRLGDTIVR